MEPSREKVLITGVSRGIGQAAAELFQHNGWIVIGIDNAPCRHAAVDCFIEADLSEPLQIDIALEKLAGYTNCLTALVNNAAYQLCVGIEQISLSEWDRVMAVNVRAPFYLAQKLYPMLASGSGSVVNVSSVHAVATSNNIAAYAASKGALVSLTRALAIDFAPGGVRVNALLPGAVDTVMLEEGLTKAQVDGHGNIEKLKEGLAARTVSGVIGSPEQMAESIYFLADNRRSGFINGQSLVADGGALARLSTE